MRRFRPVFRSLNGQTAHRLALDGDFGVANGDETEHQRTPDTADRSSGGVRVKNPTSRYHLQNAWF
jgi:hypothetical protein